MPKVIDIDKEMNLHPIVKALRVKSREPGMSLTKIAARLDVSPSYLSGLAHDRTHLNVKFLKAVSREFPDLCPLVSEYVTEGGEVYGNEA